MDKLMVTAIRCSLTFQLPAVSYVISAPMGSQARLGRPDTTASRTPITVPNEPPDIADTKIKEMW
jgi:hypothetical protein